MKAEKVEFKGVKCTNETEAAILVTIDGERHWIPKSHVDDDSEVYEKDTEGLLIISEWIATQKGLV